METLSHWIESGGWGYDCIPKSRVEEFIKKLKESFVKDKSWHISIHQGIFDKIDKLAGEKLI